MYYNKILIYPIFYLLKEGYNHLSSWLQYHSTPGCDSTVIFHIMLSRGTNHACLWTTPCKHGKLEFNLQARDVEQRALVRLLHDLKVLDRSC